jgi:hypothetical protein
MSKNRLARIFTEWAKRFAENPREFMDVLDENGDPECDYGRLCAKYFQKIDSEL